MTKQGVKQFVSELELANDGIPSGWASAKLPELTDINMGQSPPGATYNHARKGLPFFQGKADFGSRNPTVRIWCSNPKKTAQIGDVLLSIRAPVGPTNVADRECAIGRGLAALTPRGGIPSEFLLYALRAREHELSLSGTGSTFAAISKDDLEEMEFLVPPVAEQRRIVAQVEGLLGRISVARERVAKVPTILKHFRQSVLAAACSGQLTADWRRDAESENQFPESWQRKQLARLCSGFQYGSSRKSSKEGQVPVLRMGNIQQGEIDWTDLAYTSDTEEIDKYKLSANSVLFNRTNSPELVGKTGIYRGGRPAVFAGYLIRIIHGPDLVPEYLNYCLNAPEFREYCASVRTDGVSQSNINAKKLAAYEIPWCPVEEQHEVVRRVKALLALLRRVDHKATVATNRIENTTQSILARAFRGELVETEAELAHRNARSYESGAELLARIRAEREGDSLARLERSRSRI